MRFEVDGKGALAKFTLVAADQAYELNLSEMLDLGVQHANAMRAALEEGVLIPSVPPGEAAVEAPSKYLESYVDERGVFHCACGAWHRRGPMNGRDYRCLHCGNTCTPLNGSPAAAAPPTSPPMLEGKPPARVAPRPLPNVPMILNKDTGNEVPAIPATRSDRALATKGGAPICPHCNVETVPPANTGSDDSLVLFKCPKCEEYIST